MKRPGARAWLLAGVAACAASTTSRAAEWDTSGGVALTGGYTDNVCLVNVNPEGKAFATVAPDIRATGTGARANVALNARVLYNSLGDSGLNCPRGGLGVVGGRLQTFTPSGRFNGSLELVENWVTLLADASATQNALNPFAAGGEDPISGRDNLNTTYRYGAGAVAQRRFNRSVDFSLRYYYSEQQNTSDRVLFDNQVESWNGAIGMVPGTSRLTLSATGSYQQLRAERGIGQQFDNELSSAAVNASLQLSDSWQLQGTYGREWNNFLSQFGDAIDDYFWDAGVRWAPNDRIDFSAGTGERFFGETPRFSASYRHKRSLLRASYVRTIQFARNLRSPQTDPDDPFGDDFGDLPGDPPTANDSPTLIGNGPIQDDRLTLNYSWSARRTTFTLSGNDSQQIRLVDGAEGSFQSVAASITRSLSSRLNASVRTNWRNNEGDIRGGFSANAEIVTVGVNLTRRFGSDLSVTFAYQYRTQDSDITFNQFDENRVTLSTRFALF